MHTVQMQFNGRVPHACDILDTASSMHAQQGENKSFAGAPQDLVQIVTGYAEAGNALVTGGVDKVIFVGSTGVGKAVMRVGLSMFMARMYPVHS